MEMPVNILLVEDNPGDARLFKEFLTAFQAGRFAIHHIVTLAAAKEYLQEGGPCDVILLDLSLPDSTGLEIISQLQEAFSEKPMVVLTGTDDEQVGIDSLRAGAQDYLVKGQVDGRLIVRTISYAIERKRMGIERERLLQELREAKESLELRVGLRTADLTRTVETLQGEIMGRMEAEKALRESKELLEKFFDSIYLNVAYMDRDFNFIRVNRAYANAEGKEPESFVGKNHFELYPNKENAAVFREVVHIGQPCFFYEKSFGYAPKPGGGDSYWDWSLQPVKDSRGKVGGVILSLLDVTERVVAREMVDVERRRLFSVLNELPGYVSLHGTDHSIRFVNQRFVEMFGYPRGKDCYAILRGRNRPCPDCQVPAVIEEDAPREWEWTSPAGRSYHVWGYPFLDIDGTRLVMQLGIDVTERKVLQKQILEISDAERRRIGRDLHDLLGQNLTGIAFLSKVLSKRLAAKSLKEASEAEDISRHVNEVIAQTRSIAKGLCPVSLGEGLINGLQEFASKTEDVFGVSCKFHADEIVSIPDGPAVVHLYSIVQEAVANAIRHGKARHIDIELKDNSDHIVMSVRDDGIGFPEKGKFQGLGLHTMRYRAETIGAFLEIKSSPRRGAEVLCAIPKAKPTD
jgi:PAS domain S-box-containing protein